MPEWSTSPASEAKAEQLDAVPDLLQLLWKTATNNAAENRWLVALDACVWMVVRPGSNTEEANMQSWLCSPKGGVAFAALQKAKKSKSRADSLRSIVAGWAAENSVLAKNAELRRAGLETQDVGSHADSGESVPLVGPAAVSSKDEEKAVTTKATLDRVRLLIGLDDAVGEWWNMGRSSNAHATLRAVIRISAAQGHLSTIIADIGSTLTVGESRASFIRSVIITVLWSFGSELLQKIGLHTTAALRKLAPEPTGHDKNKQKDSLDAQAVALLEATVSAMSSWLGGGSSDASAAALIHEAATTVATYDTAIASPRRQRRSSEGSMQQSPRHGMMMSTMTKKTRAAERRVPCWHGCRSILRRVTRHPG
jgi:hypothetical protein